MVALLNYVEKRALHLCGNYRTLDCICKCSTSSVHLGMHCLLREYEIHIFKATIPCNLCGWLQKKSLWVGFVLRVSSCLKKLDPRIRSTPGQALARQALGLKRQCHRHYCLHFCRYTHHHVDRFTYRYHHHHHVNR